MSTETKVTNDVVIELKPGQSTEIPAGPVKASAGNNTNEMGHLYFKINPPVQTEGTLNVPPHGTVDLGFGEAGGTVENRGPVPLTIVYFLG
jgi:hypothetical protein